MTNLADVQRLLDVFVNGIDAVAANNKALDIIQFIMTSVLGAFFNAAGAAANPAGGAGIGIVKDTAFSGINYAISRAKDEFAARQVKEGTGEAVISVIATSIVGGFKQFVRNLMPFFLVIFSDAGANEKFAE